jgi:hypothetical protein
MKKTLMIITLLSCSISLFAQNIMPFRLGIFDIDIIKYPHMLQIENKQSVQIDTHYNFIDREGSYELRYTLFSQTEKNVQDIRNIFITFSIMVIYNIAGYEIDLSKFKFYNDNDVKKEFNGDFGIVGFIVDPVSDYGFSYKYISLDIFYKNNVGIFVRAIMSNNMDIFLKLDSGKYEEMFHSFKFKN